MMFNFYVNQHLFHALATGDVRPLAAAFKATKSLPPTAQWAQGRWTCGARVPDGDRPGAGFV